MPNDRALQLLAGASVGLSLLQDRPNYRHSRPTKLLEYMAAGIPVVSTPLPAAAAIVEGHKCGVIVPFEDPVAAASAVRQLLGDPKLRRRLGENGRRAACEHYNWRYSGQDFVAALEKVAQTK